MCLIRYTLYFRSILIRVRKDGQTRHLLIDACKTFKQSAVRWFPKYNVTHLDAVLCTLSTIEYLTIKEDKCAMLMTLVTVTHEHSDALLGLDDLREIDSTKPSLPLFMSERTYERVQSAFGYLMNEPPVYSEGITPGAKVKLTKVPKTWTASVKCHVFAKPELSEAKRPPKFVMEGVHVTAFPVFHGKGGNLSLGFVFGEGQSKFVYISDMNDLPKETTTFLKGLDIKVMMVDGATEFGHHHSHQNINDAIRLGKLFKVEKLFIIGIGHRIVYEEINAKLAEEKKSGLNVELSYDGMVVPLKGIDL